MDGVIYHGNEIIAGAERFVAWLKRAQKRFLFLTNTSEITPLELQRKLMRMGIEVDEDHFYTSALATASFLQSQCPSGKIFVIGGPGLIKALCDVGFTITDTAPDYVVVGETRTYNYDKIEQAALLVEKGARLIGTNPDVTDPSEKGIVPSTGALLAPIELTTGRKAYYVGKPNPLMMRHALKKLDQMREDTVIIGDRMDTDIVAGIEAEIDTVLVLSGVTSREDIQKFAYRPHHILDNVGQIAE